MKTMKIKKITLGLLLLIGLALLIFTMIQWHHDIRAEQIIHSYMVAKGINAEPGTKEYQRFMRDILLSGHHELSRISNFIKNEEEIRYVDNYAWKYSGYDEIYGKYTEPDAKEAPVLLTPMP